jgi:hypothetical protein
MGIIVVHIDSQEDTKTLVPAYEGLEDAVVLYNPSREEVIAALKEHPGDTAMFLGHGGPSGMFSVDWRGRVVDASMKDLLKDREIIGIWCHASDFGWNQSLKGFFTSMFISNQGEARAFGYKATDEECFEQNRLFAGWVNELIKSGTPLKEWPDILRSKADMSIGFVAYNYKPLVYYDGTQEPEEDDFEDWYFNKFGPSKWSGSYKPMSGSCALDEGFSDPTEGDEIVMGDLFPGDKGGSDYNFIRDCADDFLSLIYPDCIERDEILDAIINDVIADVYETADECYSSEDVEIAVRRVILKKITE